MLNIIYLYIILIGLILTGCANTTTSSTKKFLQNYDNKYIAKYERIFNKVTMKNCYKNMSVKNCYIFTIADLEDAYAKELSLIINNSLSIIKNDLGTTNIDQLLPYLNRDNVLNKLKYGGQYYNKKNQLLLTQKENAFDRIAREETYYIKVQKDGVVT